MNLAHPHTARTGSPAPVAEVGGVVHEGRTKCRAAQHDAQVAHAAIGPAAIGPTAIGHALLDRKLSEVAGRCGVLPATPQRPAPLKRPFGGRILKQDGATHPAKKWTDAHLDDGRITVAEQLFGDGRGGDACERFVSRT